MWSVASVGAPHGQPQKLALILREPQGLADHWPITLILFVTNYKNMIHYTTTRACIHVPATGTSFLTLFFSHVVDDSIIGRQLQPATLTEHRSRPFTTFLRYLHETVTCIAYFERSESTQENEDRRRAVVLSSRAETEVASEQTTTVPDNRKGDGLAGE